MDDFSDSILSILSEDKLSANPINVGSGEGVSVKNLIFIIKQVVGFSGHLQFDTSKPDGMMKKVLDVSGLGSFWSKKRSLKISVQYSFRDFLLRNEFCF